MTGYNSVLRALRRAHVVMIVLLATAALITQIPTAHAAPMLTMYVRVADPAAGVDPALAKQQAMDTIKALGGTIRNQLDIVGGFLADIPANASATDVAVSMPSNVKCWAPAGSRFNNWKFDTNAPYDPVNDPWGLYQLGTATVPAALRSGAAATGGMGVDVALIDTGVAPVGDLADPKVVIHGPDFSYDAQASELAHNDLFGHGTHMAGIIHAVAPLSRMVDLKVGDRNGATDVTQVIAALDWARKHRTDYGMNIGVINLSYGIYSPNNSRIDELSKAVDDAWKAGIVVVVSAGNVSKDDDPIVSTSGLLAPSYNQNIIAVGAYESPALLAAGAAYWQNSKLADFSMSSTRKDPRLPDVGAPGSHIASLRVPGSLEDSIVANDLCDPANPYPIVGNGKYIRGSGTSQATAFAAGAVALLRAKFWYAPPDTIKRLLKSTAHSIAGGQRSVYGDGAIDLSAALDTGNTSLPISYTQTNDVVTGGGSIEATRGTSHMIDSTGTTFGFTGVSPNICLNKFDSLMRTSPILTGGVALCGDQSMFAATQYNNSYTRSVYPSTSFDYAPAGCTTTPTLGGTAPACLGDVWAGDGRVWAAAPATQSDPNNPFKTQLLYYMQGNNKYTQGFVKDAKLGMVWPTVPWAKNWAFQDWPSNASTSMRWTSDGWKSLTNAPIDCSWERSSWRLGSWRGENFSASDFERSSWRLGSWRLGSWREFGYR